MSLILAVTGTHPVPRRPSAGARSMLHTMRAWFGTTGGKLTFVAVLYFVAHASWLFLSGPGVHRAFIADIWNLPLVPVAMIAAWRTSRIPALERRLQRAWLLGSIALLCSAVGHTWWFVDRYVGGDQSLASVEDVIYLATYPLMFASLVSFPSASRTRSEAVKLGLDAGAVLLAGGAGIWYFILGPALKTPSITIVEALLMAAYPVGDLVLLFGSVWALLHKPCPAGRTALAMLASAGVVVFLSDVAYGHIVLSRGKYTAGIPVDLGWQLAMLLCVMSAQYQRFSADRVRCTDGEPRNYAGISLLPYLAVVAGFAMLVKSVLPVWNGKLALGVATVSLLCVIVVVRQILAVREAARLMAERHAGEARFQSLVQYSSDVISIVDNKGVLRFVSPAAVRVFHWSGESIVGREITGLIHPDDVPSACAFLASAARQPGETSSFICRLLGGDGRWRHVETLCTSLLHDPIVSGLVLNTRDVSDRTRLEAELTRRAYNDPLTGLSNRVRFQVLTEEALRRPQRREGHAAVVFIDLDNFKNINDSLGHMQGDRLLVEFSARLLNATRGCDTVSRLGGDEFAVLLENLQREDDAIPVAERITAAMKKPFHLGSSEVVIGASIGIAHASSESTAEELLRNADVAMYVAKRDGKGRHTVFRPEMQHAVRRYQELESDLRGALERDEFRLVFQPIVDLRDGRVVSAEALLRWLHPTRGLVAPDAFLDAAIESGLIVPIGRFVLHSACEYLAHWRALFPQLAEMTLSVNVAGRQFQLESFPAEVAAAIELTELPADRLVLEITESEIMKETHATLTRLHALKALGVRIAIDDFGTGYSSLAYLQRFPVDVLKIDKSFVDQVAFPGHGQSLARMIIGLGETLGMRTVAEGIQDAEQAAALREMRCLLAQGYYFSAPVDADEFLRRAVASIPSFPGEHRSLVPWEPSLGDVESEALSVL